MTTIAARRSRLQQARRDLEDRLARIRRDRTRAGGPLDPDFEEQAVECENDEVLDRLESSSLTELGKVEHALAHLERGRGNRCECCGTTIPRARLEAVIHATQCTRCVEGSNNAPTPTHPRNSGPASVDGGTSAATRPRPRT